MAAPSTPVVGPLTFFPGMHVLVTGATGFLGKVVLEKLLREVPALGKIFLLVRPCPKHGTPPPLRLRDEILGTYPLTPFRSPVTIFKTNTAHF